MGKTSSSPNRRHQNPESERWVTAARPPALAPAEVHVWSFDLDVPHWRVHGLSALLSPDETDRAERFRFARDRNRYIAGRGTLRELLAAYTGSAAAALRFAYGWRGKPALEGAGGEARHFNLAHASGRALLAVSGGPPLGVDLEEVVLVPDLDDVAATHFSAAEREQLSALAGSERLAAFYRIWTRKEAYLKAVGDGLAAPLHAFSVSLPRDQPKLLAIEGDAAAAARWTVHHLEPAAGFVGALAVPAAISVSRLRWPAPE